MGRAAFLASTYSSVLLAYLATFRYHLNKSNAQESKVKQATMVTMDTGNMVRAGLLHNSSVAG